MKCDACTRQGYPCYDHEPTWAKRYIHNPDDDNAPGSPPDLDPAPGRCPDCNGKGYIAAYGCGDQAGGWADTCQECNGTGDPDPNDPPWPDAPCHNCGDLHATQRCPEIVEALANPGRAIFRHVHTQPRQFLAAYRGWDDATRCAVAAAYAAYRGWTVERALATWRLGVQGASVPARALHAGS